MNFTITGFSLFFVLAVFACQDVSQEENIQNELHEKVMAIHDEVMPQMGEINRIQRKLNSLLDENPADSVLISNYTVAIVNLNNAHEGMMEWMANYKSPVKMRDSNSHEQIMAYLKGEEEKINNVKKRMLVSMEEGKELLESVPE